MQLDQLLVELTLFLCVAKYDPDIALNKTLILFTKLFSTNIETQCLSRTHLSNFCFQYIFENQMTFFVVYG